MLARAATLDTIKQRGQLVCGVSTGFAGFSTPDSQGNFKGLDADYCRAMGAAIFGDAMRRLAGAATYLYQDGPRYWYSTVPTVTKLADDRADQLLRECLEKGDG